jgi:hypothetical protein
MGKVATTYLLVATAMTDLLVAQAMTDLLATQVLILLYFSLRQKDLIRLQTSSLDRETK